MVIVPWTFILGLTWLVNRWQFIFRPLGGLLWYGVDWVDQRTPAVADWLLWFVYKVSLILHTISVGVSLGVIWVSAPFRPR
jgi:hypothetical protein